MKSKLITYMALALFGLVSVNGIAQTTTISLSNSIGEVSYESKDHRSNVYEVMSDRKTINNNQFQGIIITATDYYPYGSEIGARSLISNLNIRLGFNGKEIDYQISGKNNSLNFGARIFDSRIGRFFTVDPMITHPLNTSLSSYHFALNSLLVATDENGEIWNIVVGAIAGVVVATITAVTLDKDDPHYWKKVGAAGLGTAVGVATFGMAAPAAVTALGGTTLLGTTGTVYVTGGVAIGSGMLSSAASEGFLDITGAKDFDGYEVLKGGAFGMVDAVTGGYVKKSTEPVFKKLSGKYLEKNLKKNISLAWNKEKKLVRKLKKELKIKRKTAKYVAKKIVEKSKTSYNQTSYFTAQIIENGLNLSIGTTKSIFDNEYKQEINAPIMYTEDIEDKKVKRRNKKE